MSWQPELDELRERERLARELGGADKIKRQHDAGKLTIREVADCLAEAMRHFDHHDYVELSLVAAFYAMVARMLDAMGVQLEPEMRDYAPKLP